MPVQPTFPGVYIQEVPSGVQTITGVSTSVAAFVGMVNRGPLGQPARILSFADYEREFGNDTSASEMTDQVRQFFLNGGSRWARSSTLCRSRAWLRIFRQCLELPHHPSAM